MEYLSFKEAFADILCKTDTLENTLSKVDPADREYVIKAFESVKEKLNKFGKEES